MGARRLTVCLGVLALGAKLLALPGAVTCAAGDIPGAYPVTTITLNMAKAYTPHAPPGATDDYHCTLLDPHLTRGAYIISSQFFPGSAEDHHATLYLVPPRLAAIAEAANAVGKGWTCFGEAPIPGTSPDQISNTPWLSTWAPGHGEDVLPKGTGEYFPAGSLLIMQVHYNLLVGDDPVKNSEVLHLVPESTPLLPLNLHLLPAPPDIPCPAGVTGPLCSRTAELANLGHRFGQGQVDLVNKLERLCGRSPVEPPEGDSTSCSWPVTKNGYIVRVSAHMHLLGQTFSMVLDPGTSAARTILNVPHFNFHYQRAYNLATPIPVKRGDTIQVNCSYDPTLEQELPILRRVPPHFVTWGDGSSDEMCLGLVFTTTAPPNSHFPV